jgi:hypothetical protein
MSKGMQRRDFIRSTGFVAGAAAAASLMEAPALAQTSPNAGSKPITALIEEAGFVRREPSEGWASHRFLRDRRRPCQRDGSAADTCAFQCTE